MISDRIILQGVSSGGGGVRVRLRHRTEEEQVAAFIVRKINV